MAGATSSINFAVIGHQDSWYNIERFVNGLRTAENEKLSLNKIKEIFSFIPPRTLFNVRVKSTCGTEINGIYIDTFIDPDKLIATYSKTNLKKVIQAANYAQRQGAAVVTFGGFTSILQEGNFNRLSGTDTKFTTGNTLTAAYIIEGINIAVERCNISLPKSKLLILGATGDIGMACVDYYKKRVQKLMLCARNKGRLGNLAATLSKEQINLGYNISVEQLLPEADIIICVTSSSEMNFTGYKKNVLICDAGYPKNLHHQINNNRDVHLFHGGMGQVSRGFEFEPDYSKYIYQYPAPGIAHGCILEAMVLAFENKLENYSTGKGNITLSKIDEIYQCGLKHGITLAPLFNANGLWPC